MVQQLCATAFWWAEQDWDAFSRTALSTEVGLVVIDVGVGTVANPDFGTAMVRGTWAQQHGIQVFGYVPTFDAIPTSNYQKAPEWVDRWYSNCAGVLSGMFFDMGPANWACAVDQRVTSYYHSLYTHVVAKPAQRVFLNAAGTESTNEWIMGGSSQACDIALLVEDRPRAYVDGHGRQKKGFLDPDYPMQSWASRYPGRVAHTIYSCTNEDLSAVMTLSLSRGASYVWVVDGPADPAPGQVSGYGRLPTYWSSELLLVADNRATCGRLQEELQVLKDDYIDADKTEKWRIERRIEAVSKEMRDRHCAV